MFKGINWKFLIVFWLILCTILIWLDLPWFIEVPITFTFGFFAQESCMIWDNRGKLYAKAKIALYNWSKS